MRSRMVIGVAAAALGLSALGPAMAVETAPEPTESVVETPAVEPTPQTTPPASDEPVSAAVRTEDGSLEILTADNPQELAEVTAGEQVLAVDTPVQRRVAAVGADDAGRDLQWGLNRLQAEDVWSRTNGTGVKVAILDTGVRENHPDLSGQVVGGYNAITGQAGKPADQHGHGTFLAGMIAGKINGSGIEGLAPGAKIMPVKVLDAEGLGDSDAIARGIIWATDAGADIINMSFASDVSNRVEAEAIAYARGAGVTLVAAGGNEGMRLTMYPAAYPGVLGVGATDFNNNRATFSNTGGHIDVAAPGQGILSTYIGRNYSWESGTSMSTAYVSAMAALAASYSPGAGGEPLQQQIIATARDIGAAGPDPETGAGLIDPAALIEQMGGGQTPGMTRDLEANGAPDGKITIRFTAPAGHPYYVQFKGGRNAPAGPGAGSRVAEGTGAGQAVTVEVPGKNPKKTYAVAVFTTGPEGISRTIATVRPLKWTLTPTRTVARKSTQRLEVGAKVKGFGWIGGYRLLMATQKGGKPQKVRKFVPSPDGPEKFIVRDLQWSFHYQFTLQAPGFWNAASPTNSQYIETGVEARRGGRITGQVSPNKAPSEVQLQRKAGKGWKTLHTAKTKRNGKFSLPSASGTIRVYAPADLWRGPAAREL